MDISIQFTKPVATVAAQAKAFASTGAMVGQNFSAFMSAVTARSQDPAPARDDAKPREPEIERPENRTDNREDSDHRPGRSEKTAHDDKDDRDPNDKHRRDKPEETAEEVPDRAAKTDSGQTDRKETQTPAADSDTPPADDAASQETQTVSDTSEKQAFVAVDGDGNPLLQPVSDLITARSEGETDTKPVLQPDKADQIISGQAGKDLLAGKAIKPGLQDKPEIVTAQSGSARTIPGIDPKMTGKTDTVEIALVKPAALNTPVQNANANPVSAQTPIAQTLTGEGANNGVMNNGAAHNSAMNNGAANNGSGQQNNAGNSHSGALANVMTAVQTNAQKNPLDFRAKLESGGGDTSSGPIRRGCRHKYAEHTAPRHRSDGGAGGWRANRAKRRRPRISAR